MKNSSLIKIMTEDLDQKCKVERQLKEVTIKLEEYKQNEKEYIERAQEAEKEKQKYKNRIRDMDHDIRKTKETYKKLFLGQVILIIVLSGIFAYIKIEVFSQIIEWFIERGNNIKDIVISISSIYTNIFNIISNNLGISSPLSNILAILLVILMISISFIILSLIIRGTYILVLSVKERTKDKLLKRTMSGVITIAIFYICLLFSEEISSIIPLNIFSVWILLSLFSLIIYHILEIRDSIEDTKDIWS